MGILSTNKKIINLGQGYSAGSGISIDDYVISVTGEFGKTYSAGQNIDIYDDQGQLYISGKDWSEDISNASANAYNTTTAWVVENYDNSSAVDYISGVVDNISSNVNNINSAVDYYSGSIDYISSTVDNKLDTTAWSTISGDYATTSYVDMNDDLTYDRTTAWVDQNYVADSEISDASGVWDDTSNCVQTNSGAWSNGGGTYDVITANSANWNNVSSKLDISSFESYTATVASGDYELSAGVGISLYDDALNEITRIDVTGSFDNEEVNQVVETNSAAWSNNPGDVNVNNYVYNNSAINDAVNGLVSSNSASWNGKLNKLDFDTYSADINGYIATLYDNDSYFSGAIDYLSGNAGKTYTGISPIVVNNTTNEISADSQDITFGEGLDFTNGVLTVTAGGGGTTYTGDAQGALDEVYANSGVWLTAHQDISNKLDTTAFSTVSGTFLTAHQQISANEWNSVYETVETNSGSWAGGGSVDMSAYVPYSANNLAFLGTQEIYKNSAVGYNTIAHGNANTASAMSIAQGFGNRAGWESLAQGGSCTASGSSLAQGDHCYASAHSFAQGFYCSAKKYSISNGKSNYANDFSQAFGNSNTITTSGMAIGTYNKTSSNVSFVIGNGTSNNARSDSFIIYHDGSVSAAGKISANGVELGAGGGGTSLTGDAQGAVDEVYSNSAHWNDNYSTVTTNSASWGGTPLPMSAGDGIDIQIENDTLVISATGGAGNPEVESYVQTNSASIDEVVSTYETNSATYMTEPNLEYNAVNEISGYNGSAIAQYGAEKQWLQHDDTIVHVANSAQYAFGVNVSAVAQLLGVDETVLFEDTTASKQPQSSITLSEPANNFNKIDIWYRDRYNNIGDTNKILHTSNITFDNENTSRVILPAPFLYTTATPMYMRISQYKFSNTTSMAFESDNLIQITPSGIKCNFSTTTDNNGNFIYKVVGIGRKS